MTASLALPNIEHYRSVNDGSGGEVLLPGEATRDARLSINLSVAGSGADGFVLLRREGVHGHTGLLA
jgi:hypothetical protein